MLGCSGDLVSPAYILMGLMGLVLASFGVVGDTEWTGLTKSTSWSLIEAQTLDRRCWTRKNYLDFQSS